jgi:hypothetical protein
MFHVGVNTFGGPVAPFAQPFLWGVSAGTIGLILSMTAQILPLSIRGAVDAAVAVLALARFRAPTWGP